MNIFTRWQDNDDVIHSEYEKHFEWAELGKSQRELTNKSLWFHRDTILNNCLRNSQSTQSEIRAMILVLLSSSKLVNLGGKAIIIATICSQIFESAKS